MADSIQAIFIYPPIAVARLGGSNTPLDSYRWVDSPDAHLQTVITPDWTLDVDADGAVSVRMPQALQFRDGGLIRPVVPFFELWAMVGENGTARDKWKSVPLTSAMLQRNEASGFTLTVDARNSKAARRVGNQALEFGTFPPVAIQSDNHRVVALVGTSPPGVVRPMIPRDSSGIPLGSVQMLRSQPQPAPGTTEWTDQVDVEVIRFRFTPAKGLFYGPMGADRIRENGFAPVDQRNAFLDPEAGWVGAGFTPWMEPADTFDGAESQPPRSLGIVDDTCSATLRVTLRLGNGQALEAHANLFVAPPDFAPDRRPFLSLADELNDRSARADELSDTELSSWVRDLFERVYETASLLNVDRYRNERAITLQNGELRANPLIGDGVPEPNRAMGGLDKLRAEQIAIVAPLPDRPLPLSERAQARHRNLAELNELVTLILEQPQRLRDLIRPPFSFASDEDPNSSNMQMPPFMRNSNAFPLTLAPWQYNLLFKWVDQIRDGQIRTAAVSRLTEMAAAASSASPGRVRAAEARRQQVLRCISRR